MKRMHSLFKAPTILVAMMIATAVSAHADDTANTPRKVPAKTLQVPTADVSPEMQKLIAAPLNPAWNDQFNTGEAWRKFADHQPSKSTQAFRA